MTCAPAVSVIIPTRSRPQKLAACLARLASQEPPSPSFEVVIATDGPDPASAEVARAFDSSMSMVLIEAPREGIASVKNHAIAASRGDLLLLINDDVLPAPDFVARHVQAHEQLDPAYPAMILGHSPWVVEEPDRLFDRVLRSSSMIFFYDRMLAAPDRLTRDWGYRHAWNLNLSLPRREAEAVGGFRPAIANCCYEDVEFAWRLAQERKMPVLFRPEALAPHDHRYDAGGYLDREFRLGYSAYGLAIAAPQCAEALFRDDVRSREYGASCEALIERLQRDEQMFRERFGLLQDMPADSIDGPHAGYFLQLAYEHHLPLKRLAFARGMVAAHRHKAIEGLFHPLHGLATAPGLPIPIGL